MAVRGRCVFTFWYHSSFALAIIPASSIVAFVLYARSLYLLVSLCDSITAIFCLCKCVCVDHRKNHLLHRYSSSLVFLIYRVSKGETCAQTSGNPVNHVVAEEVQSRRRLCFSTAAWASSTSVVIDTSPCGRCRSCGIPYGPLASAPDWRSCSPTSAWVGGTSATIGAPYYGPGKKHNDLF